jgi:glycosyltransferase involved in cell wall biosynthesis
VRLTSLRPFRVLDTAERSRAPVSVCFVIDGLTRAGTETQLLALIRALNRGRVRPSLCLLGGQDAESRALTPEDCPVISLGLTKVLRPRAAVAATRLAAFWRRHQVNVVQTYFLDSTYFAVPLARLCGIHHVVRVRNNVGYWLTPVHRRLGRLVGRLATATLTNSEDGQRAIIAAESLPSDRVKVIENGVDLGRFRPGRPPDTTGRTVRVGAVANLRPVKNIDGLIRVAERLCREDSRLHFEVAGEGDQRPDLERAIHQAGLSGRFVLRGAVSDIPDFLASLDVAVLCSHSESMSNAVLEYMAAGRAIVATAVGANSRLVRHGREAIIVPPRDEAALGHGIRAYLDCPELARQTGMAARARAEAEFSRVVMVRRFEELYRALK